MANGNRKLIFSYKILLVPHFFHSRLWSKMSFLDKDCKPQRPVVPVWTDSMKRQNGRTALSLGIGDQHAGAVELGLIC